MSRDKVMERINGLGREDATKAFWACCGCDLYSKVHFPLHLTDSSALPHSLSLSPEDVHSIIALVAKATRAMSPSLPARMHIVESFARIHLLEPLRTA